LTNTTHTTPFCSQTVTPAQAAGQILLCKGVSCLQGGKEVVEQVVGYKKKPLEAAVQQLAAA
jgi:hypothetical protein